MNLLLVLEDGRSDGPVRITGHRGGWRACDVN